jgi:hypothetical protein
MPNPITITAGTTTLNSSHSLKVTKVTAFAQSATVVVVNINDLNGNPFMVPIAVPATVNGEVTADFTAPMILPGGTNLSVTNAVVTVTGAGGLAYIYHR